MPPTSCARPLGDGRCRCGTVQGVAAPLQLRFVTSADRIEGLPESPAELAVVGRSNVGKSSLLNALARSQKLAHVSKTPGRTQLLNQFVLPDGTTVVDCPGYGYAAVSKSMRAGWQQMIEGYLLGRPELRRVLALVDGEIGPTKRPHAGLARRTTPHPLRRRRLGLTRAGWPRHPVGNGRSGAPDRRSDHLMPRTPPRKGRDAGSQPVG